MTNSPAGRSGGPTYGGAFAEEHKIDWFEVADDMTDAFTLTYPPLPGSWNVELNGLGLNDHPDAGDVAYEISGRTLTVSDPSDTFRGVATQSPPWKLRVQYDYILGKVMDIYDEPTIVGVPYVVYPTVGTFRDLYFRLEGYSGDGTDFTIAFDNGVFAVSPPYTVNPANPSGCGATIWKATLQRPWFDVTPPGGIAIEVGGVSVYTTSDPITTNSSPPPIDYDG